MQGGVHKFTVRANTETAAADEPVPRVRVSNLESVIATVTNLGGDARVEDIITVEEVARSCAVKDKWGNKFSLYEEQTAASSGKQSS